MIIQSIAFYVFAGIIIASAIMVVSAKNPVHSVLFLESSKFIPLDSNSFLIASASEKFLDFLYSFLNSI